MHTGGSPRNLVGVAKATSAPDTQKKEKVPDAEYQSGAFSFIKIADLLTRIIAVLYL